MVAPEGIYVLHCFQKKTHSGLVSDIKRGKINQFSMDLLVRLAARAGLHPKLKLVA